MREIIESFPNQFSFKPEVVNSDKLPKVNKFVVGGMGGSHLAADLLKIWRPELDLSIHFDYGLPITNTNYKLPVSDTLFIASSYSGNTEETVDFLEKAIERGLPAAAIGTGGRIIEIAKKEKLPYIIFPGDAGQPRFGLGYSFKSLLKIVGDEIMLRETTKLAEDLKPGDYEEEGKVLAEKLKDALIVPVYASRGNLGLALNWKIRLNENAKIPSYLQFFPELNHNEMAAEFGSGFHFIILKDESDNPKVIKRMDILIKLYQEKHLPVEVIPLKGEGLLKFFSSVILADWTSYYLALGRGIDPFSNYTVEKFKKIIA